MSDYETGHPHSGFCLQGQTITATVEINNFPVGRPNKASASGDIGRILYGNYTSIDQYDYLPWREEKMRIDSSVLVELANDESAIVYYIISSPEKEPSPT